MLDGRLRVLDGIIGGAAMVFPADNISSMKGTVNCISMSEQTSLVAWVRDHLISPEWQYLMELLTWRLYTTLLDWPLVGHVALEKGLRIL